jgi:hypothetical protein
VAQKSAAKNRRHRASEGARAISAATGKDAAPAPPSDLSETEQDLLSHLQNRYDLETDSLGSDVLLRQPKQKEFIRPLSATRNTVKALEERGLIVPAKGDDPLRIIWRLEKGKKTNASAQKKPSRVPARECGTPRTRRPDAWPRARCSRQG